LKSGRAVDIPKGTYPDGNVVEFWSHDMAAYTNGAREGGAPGTFRSDE
jgi:hypothetical protein